MVCSAPDPEQRSNERSSGWKADSVKLSASQVADELRAGGLPLTYPVTDVGTGPLISGSDSIPGLLAHAVTATDSLDIDIRIFDSASARESRQRWQGQNLERARATTEPGALPDFMASAACGPILIDLIQVSESGTGREQHKQVQEILERRFGPC